MTFQLNQKVILASKKEPIMTIKNINGGSITCFWLDKNDTPQREDFKSSELVVYEKKPLKISSEVLEMAKSPRIRKGKIG